VTRGSLVPPKSQAAPGALGLAVTIRGAGL
jgi:hypothetical protein